MIEFVEGEPSKFLLVSGDHRLHFKASGLDEKQQWIKSLRTSILSMSSLSVPKVAGDRKGNFLEPEGISIEDLRDPSPLSSPRHGRKEILIGNGTGTLGWKQHGNGTTGTHGTETGTGIRSGSRNGSVQVVAANGDIPRGNSSEHVQQEVGEEPVTEDNRSDISFEKVRAVKVKRCEHKMSPVKEV